jgi:hypothetical protein
MPALATDFGATRRANFGDYRHLTQIIPRRGRGTHACAIGGVAFAAQWLHKRLGGFAHEIISQVLGNTPQPATGREAYRTKRDLASSRRVTRRRASLISSGE